MAIELKDVEHLAGLARIAISEEEKKILQRDLEEILGYVSTTGIGVGPSEYILEEELRNVMREDTEPHASGKFTEDILSQAPVREGNRISVKKIM